MSNSIYLKVCIAATMTVTCWSLSVVIIRSCVDVYGIWDIELGRFLLATITLAFLQRDQLAVHRFTKRELVCLFALATIGLTFYNYFLISGELGTPASITGFILSQIPVLTALLASYILKEKLSSQSILGLFISVIGVSMIAFNQYDGHLPLQGFIKILAACCCAACFIVYQKPLLKQHNPLIVTTYLMCFATMLCVFDAPHLWHMVLTVPVVITLELAFLGLFSTAIAYACWSYALDNAPAAKVSSTLYAMPILTSIFSYFLLGEVPTLMALTGGCTAIAGAIVVNMG